jgi:hypothetical protein
MELPTATILYISTARLSKDTITFVELVGRAKREEHLTRLIDTLL